MELKDFIKQTLLDLAGAIKETNEDESSNIIVNPKHTSSGAESEGYAYKEAVGGGTEDTRPIQKIKFDVAVTTAGAIQGETGAGINVAGLKVGGSGEVKDEHQNESRIQFEIPVALPNGEYR